MELAFLTPGGTAATLFLGARERQRRDHGEVLFKMARDRRVLLKEPLKNAVGRIWNSGNQEKPRGRSDFYRRIGTRF